MTKRKLTLTKIVFIAMLSALVCVVTMYRFPLLGSKVHFANAVCLLSGLLMGPVSGGLAAGLGSALYDVLLGGYGAVECLVTFVSKFAMAWVCGVIAFSGGREAKEHLRNVAASVIGALTYVALYMLKTFVFQAFVYGFPMNAVWATMLSKFIPSMINAVFAMLAAPVLMRAIYPMLKATGLLKKMHG